MQVSCLQAFIFRQVVSWKISKVEDGKINDDALKILARASEGSVRDAISLLDRALTFQSLNNNKIIDDKDVRKMLGLADKTKLIALLKHVFEGKEEEAPQTDENQDQGVATEEWVFDANTSHWICYVGVKGKGGRKGDTKGKSKGKGKSIKGNCWYCEKLGHRA